MPMAQAFGEQIVNVSQPWQKYSQPEIVSDYLIVAPQNVR